MKVRTLLLGLLTAGLAQGLACGANAGDPIQLMLRTGPESPDLGVVRVDGEPDGRYAKVLTETLEYDVYARGDRPSNAVSNLSVFRVQLEDGEKGGGGLSGEWKKYTVTMPYRDPADTTPVALCNQRLDQAAGSARERFLKEGATFSHGGAYRLFGSVDWVIKDAFGPTTKIWRKQMMIPVKIRCLGLNRNVKEPKPSRTTPPPVPSRTTPPLFSKTTFEIEPSKIVKDGRYLCPSELRLYGYIEANGAFEGKSIFMGPQYLSAITELDISRDGSRNVISSYPMKWHQVGGLAAQANAKPADQKLTFRFNISDLEGKLVKSMEKTITVSCKKIKPNDAAVGGEMTTTPAN